MTRSAKFALAASVLALVFSFGGYRRDAADDRSIGEMMSLTIKRD